MSIETFNKYMVGSQNGQIVIMSPPLGRLSARDALLLAAYLVTMAEANTDVTFEQVREAVEST